MLEIKVTLKNTDKSELFLSNAKKRMMDLKDPTLLNNKLALEHIRENILKSRAPNGGKIEPSERVKIHGGVTLYLSKALFNTLGFISKFEKGKTKSGLISGVIYAAIHNFGGKIQQASGKIIEIPERRYIHLSKALINDMGKNYLKHIKGELKNA